jgi:hypothetical protein
MERGCHGRFLEAEKNGRKQLRTEEHGENWQRRGEHTKGCSAK